MTSNYKTWQAVCLGLIAAVTPALVTALLVTFVFSGLQDSRSRAEGDEGRASMWESLEIDSTGRALIRVRSGEAEHWLDSRREPVDEPSNLMLPVADLERRHPRVLFHHNGRAMDVSVIPLTYPGTLDVDWFLVLVDQETGKARFEGYNHLTAKQVGWIGIDGFVETPLSPEAHFTLNPDVFRTLSSRILLTAEALDWKARSVDSANTIRGKSPLLKHQVTLLAGERLFLVNLEQRTTEELLPEAAVQAVDSAVRLSRGVETHTSFSSDETLRLDPYIVARTADRLILLSPGAKLREEYALSADVRDRDFRLYLPTDGSAVLQLQDVTTPSQLESNGSQYSVDVKRIAVDGSEKESEQVTVHRSYFAAFSRRTRMSAMALAIPAPLVSMLIATTENAISESLPFSTALSRAFGDVWPALIFIMLVALVLAWWTDRKQRSSGLGRSVPWLVFVFLFGIPGFVAWLVHRRWPIQNPAPQPRRLGIEIFG